MPDHCTEGGDCDVGQHLCRNQAECDRASEHPTERSWDKPKRDAFMLKVLSSPAHELRCPSDRSPPPHPQPSQPASIITRLQVGTVNVQLVNGEAVSGPSVPIRVTWPAVTDACPPVTYSVVVEYYHCHQVGDLVESATYHNRGWCQWMHFSYQSISTATTFSFNYPFGTHLYDIHLPFATELGWDLTFTGTRQILYAPFWLRVRVISHDGNGTAGLGGIHDDDRYFVLYADGTVPLDSLAHIPP
jgi:hypothetical protein